MTTLIHYKGSPNLPVLLTQLQPQLSENDDIYIVDSTPTRNALKIAKLYGSTRCYTFVEVGDYTQDQAVEFARQSAIENKQSGLLVINENAIISSTFIGNLKRTFDLNFSTIQPQILKTIYPQMPAEFKWYNPPTQSVMVTQVQSKVCFYEKLKNPGIDKFVLSCETIVVLDPGFVS